MLNIYYGRETINKEKFIYENAESGTVFLVPDQFTIQAERDAFFYTGKKGLMDLEVLSFSRMADRVFSQTGGSRIPMIDKRGRHMLLTKIMRDLKEELQVYRSYSANTAFIEMANNFISEIKQYGKGPDDLAELIGTLQPGRYAVRKLQDIHRIFEEYEGAIQGKYIDTEDRIDLLIEKMPQAPFVRDNRFCIYGFDWFAPRNRLIISELMQHSRGVDIVMTWDGEGEDRELFAMTGDIIAGLKKEAEESGVPFRLAAIGETDGKSYEEERPAGIAALEKCLFAMPRRSVDATAGITLVKAANFYSEAETAAAKILELVREKGMRYRDIAVICNDLTGRGSIYKRVFAQYGIRVFLDEKRSIMNHPVVNYIIALNDCIAGSFKRRDVIRVMKTGLTDLTRDQVEELENYLNEYNIRGSGFREDFTRGADENGVGAEKLAELNEYRKVVMDDMTAFWVDYHEAKTVREKVECLYTHITQRLHLDQKTEQMIEEQKNAGRLELAAASAQIWNIIMAMFDQMAEVAGDIRINQKDFAIMFRSGFEAVEIGLLPPGLDGVMMGTMQRTRTGHIKALLVMGANEGVLPAEAADDGILTENEKIELAEIAEIEFCKLDRLRVQEEDMAIYRNISKPAEELWVSCSVSDEEGKALRPSPIYTAIREVCPQLEEQQDIVSAEAKDRMMSAPEIALSHLTEDLREGMLSGELDDWSKECWLWFVENMPEKAAVVKDGLMFRNEVEPLEKEIVQQLFGKGGSGDGKYVFSPSRLEKFGGCPFAHFVYYGLRPENPGTYTIDAADAGTISHYCMEKIASELTREGMDITDEQSPWMNITQADCREKVDQIIEEYAAGYRDGLAASSGTESYRLQRVKDVVQDAVWMMICHVRAGKVKSMGQEIHFGRGQAIAPVKVDTPNGTVCIEGFIDRVDLLPGDNVKVIDYKTGVRKYYLEDALAGKSLQLFIYLRAAGTAERHPAGAFYFSLPEKVVSLDDVKADEVEATIAKSRKRDYRMEGFVVEDPEILQAIDGEMENESDIIPVSYTKDGKLKKTSEGRILPREEFDQVLDKVNGAIDDLCKDLVEGNIRISPLRKGTNYSACTYCDCRGICKFDPVFSGCRYREIRKSSATRNSDSNSK